MKHQPDNMPLLWQRFNEIHECPVCEHDAFDIRKMCAERSKQYPNHWKYKCKNCKAQWWKPWELLVNTEGA